MTNKLLSIGLIAAALLATPVIARESGIASRRIAAERTAVASDATSYRSERACIPAPRVGAFATAPWTGTNVPCEPGTGGF